jgi:hypothetical protein
MFWACNVLPFLLAITMDSKTFMNFVCCSTVLYTYRGQCAVHRHRANIFEICIVRKIKNERIFENKKNSVKNLDLQHGTDLIFPAAVSNCLTAVKMFDGGCVENLDEKLDTAISWSARFSVKKINNGKINKDENRSENCNVESQYPEC